MGGAGSIFPWPRPALTCKVASPQAALPGPLASLTPPPRPKQASVRDIIHSGPPPQPTLCKLKTPFKRPHFIVSCFVLGF